MIHDSLPPSLVIYLIITQQYSSLLLSSSQSCPGHGRCSISSPLLSSLLCSTFTHYERAWMSGGGTCSQYLHCCERDNLKIIMCSILTFVLSPLLFSCSPLTGVRRAIFSEKQLPRTQVSESSIASILYSSPVCCVVAC